jgi:hypothetical protein
VVFVYELGGINSAASRSRERFFDAVTPGVARVDEAAIEVENDCPGMGAQAAREAHG